ncbi:MAG: OmpA family protein [Pseudomonadota bacterium]
MIREDKEDPPEIKADSNAWMVTFSDLTMLLLTFFVMLLTMKSMETGKARELFMHSEGPLEYVAPENQAENALEGENFLNSVTVTSMETIDKAIELLEGIAPIPAKDGTTLGLRDLITEVTENERSVIISLEADALFESGHAEIRGDRLYLLNSVGQLFRYATNDILVMGHTDDIPVTGNRFASNLELSVYRALNVLHYLIDNQGLKPERLAAGGYGDLLPRYPNDSPENRAKNRRVEFVLRKPI